MQVSILFSVRAYIKSRKEKKAKSDANSNAQQDSNDDGDDVLSVEVIHIGHQEPNSVSKPSPGIPTSPARSPLVASKVLTTATKETTL
ncbi:unnamed protein product [Phytophthora lilii]|uniref:Unnamed protein product n=1 Tax=Phytophthora lilii TaxID=2077276 RepID=A0A9W6YJW4_9STRA|nr:unnamed protein product [Phytophthora lilii]